MKRFISLFGLRQLNEREIESIKNIRVHQEQNAILLLKAIAYSNTDDYHYYERILGAFNRNIKNQLDFYKKIERTADTRNIKLDIFMDRSMYYCENDIEVWAGLMRELKYMTNYKSSFGQNDVNSYLFFRDEGAKVFYFEIEVDKIPDKSNLYYYTRENLVGARMFPQY